MYKCYCSEVSKSHCAILVKTEIEVAKAHTDAVDIRNHWFGVFEDLQKECQKQIKKLTKELEVMEKRVLRAERDRSLLLR